MNKTNTDNTSRLREIILELYESGEVYKKWTRRIQTARVIGLNSNTGRE